MINQTKTIKILGEEPVMGPECKIVNSQFGKYTEIGSFNFMENTKIGDYSYTGQHCFIQNTDIKKFSNIAAMVRFGPTRHPMDRPSLHHFTYRKRKYGFDIQDDEEFFQWRASQVISVGHDTWFGHGAIIMPGVSIGTGSVIGAGSVVTKDVPPYTIAVGVPARPIKYRFTERQVEALFRIKWWNWSHEDIKNRLEDFYLSIDEFIEIYGSNK
jgi:phosphonate metabolism protein (transferase hexapeptide repeat family)